MSRSRDADRGLILVYHAVADPPEDPFKLAVARARFAAHLEIISALYQPLRLAELVRGLVDHELPRGAIAVTFDDGYANNLTAALPELTQHGVPATVFVVTGYTGSEQEFWWDELERLLAMASHPGPRRMLEVSINGDSLSCDVGHRSLALRRLWRWLHRREQHEIDSVLAQVRAWAGVGEPLPPRETHRPMTVSELQSIHASGLVELAPHTRSHPVLAARTASAQREEVQGSRRDLQEWLGGTAAGFAYPYGNPAHDYSRATVQIVRELGFDHAVGTSYGVATPSSPRYELPRFFVGDLPAEEFERWLDTRLARRSVRMARRLAFKPKAGRG